MNFEELVQQGKTTECLGELKKEVQANPADARLRTFLFQLLAVVGDWDRAAKQLDVLKDIDAATIPMVQMYKTAIGCEKMREGVFSGERAPQVLGEPPQWLAELIEVTGLVANSHWEQAAAAGSAAFDKAEATAGKVNGEPFEWLADGDARLGPVLEAYINGQYYWIPFANVSKVQIEDPTDLRDLVWLPAHLTLSNEGTSIAMLPVRYPGSASVDDGRVQLARVTEWDTPVDDFYLGRGQRVFVSDGGDYSILDIRQLEFDVAQGN